MAHIRPFAAIRFARKSGPDISSLIAPPYDVLDEKGKAALQAKDPHNIVSVDLPHLPAKSVGPDSTYESANITMAAWLNSGVLIQDPRPALYPYSQTYDHGGKTYHRRGFIALVRLSPFGKGEVIPHEKTYREAIEDRLKLTRATGVQLSPIFGLYSDPRKEINGLLYKGIGRPELTATLDGVRSDLWSVIDAETENAAIDFMKHKPVYIADGHHRYTTALQYQKEAQERNGGPLPEQHPANWCLFVLISMQDDGLLILPTHRLLGGLKNFSIEALKAKLGGNATLSELAVGADHVNEYVNSVLPKQGPNVFGLFDGKTRKLHQLKLVNMDVLRALEPGQSDAWRKLDVAVLQRYLLDEVIGPTFAAGGEVKKGYTADPDTIAPQVDGERYQIAMLLQPTPLQALEELGKHNEVMPQKSTYFFPKLATGMVINPVK